MNETPKTSPETPPAPPKPRFTFGNGIAMLADGRRVVLDHVTHYRAHVPNGLIEFHLKPGAVITAAFDDQRWTTEEMQKAVLEAQFDLDMWFSLYRHKLFAVTLAKELGKTFPQSRVSGDGSVQTKNANT